MNDWGDCYTGATRTARGGGHGTSDKDRAQGFEDVRTDGFFYVDKTALIRDWWRSRDEMTLVCRPRRFGKTLNLDTVRCFLSRDYAGRGKEVLVG